MNTLQSTRHIPPSEHLKPTHACTPTQELYNETTIHTILKLTNIPHVWHLQMVAYTGWPPIHTSPIKSDTKQIKRGAKLTRRSVLANKNVSELPTQTHKSHHDFPHHVHNLVMQELLNNIPRTQRSNNECSTKKCYWKHAGKSISKRSSDGKPIPLACKFKALKMTWLKIRQHSSKQVDPCPQQEKS